MEELLNLYGVPKTVEFFVNEMQNSSSVVSPGQLKGVTIYQYNDQFEVVNWPHYINAPSVYRYKTIAEAQKGIQNAFDEYWMSLSRFVRKEASNE